MNEAFIELEGSDVSLRLHQHGGAIVDASYQGRPILRPYRGDESTAFDVLDAGCFPLVPFAGRIEGNAFNYDDHPYSLRPNTTQDRHVLHGDGWLGTWELVEKTPTDAVLSFHHGADSASPFTYDAQQRFSVSNGQLSMQLSVTQRGSGFLPFGLGLHPYFPLTPDTLVQFSAGGVWDEREHHLPGALGPISDLLDFSVAKGIPNQGIHAGFEHWNGEATLHYPDRMLKLHVKVGSTSQRLQLFRPDAYAAGSEPYVCLEPMTHTCNAHHLAGDYGLRRLGPGESLSLSLVILPENT
jgi:aldose 1-epimerase